MFNPSHSQRVLRGYIHTIYVFSDGEATNGSQRAVVVFSQAAEAGTALLLSGATIVDQAITISKYSAPSANVAAADEVGTAQAPPAQETVPPPASAQRPTTVIASLLAAGFLLADEVIEKAKSFDGA